MAPERLARVLMDDGWLIRNKIVWAKTNSRPTSATDRLACAWEAIYLLVRSPRYYFHLDAIRVPHTSRPPRAKPRASSEAEVSPSSTGAGLNSDSSRGLDVLKARGLVGHPLGKNPRDVWSLADQQLPRRPLRHLSARARRAHGQSWLPGAALYRLPDRLASESRNDLGATAFVRSCDPAAAAPPPASAAWSSIPS